MTPQCNPAVAYVAVRYWLFFERLQQKYGIPLHKRLFNTDRYLDDLYRAWPGIDVKLIPLYRERREEFPNILKEFERELWQQLSTEERRVALLLIADEWRRLEAHLFRELNRPLWLLLELAPDATNEEREARMECLRLLGREDLAEPAELLLEQRSLTHVAGQMGPLPTLKDDPYERARDKYEAWVRTPESLIAAFRDEKTWSAGPLLGDAFDRAVAVATEKLKYQQSKDSRVVPESQQQVDIEIEEELATDDASPEEWVTRAFDTEDKWRILEGRASSLPRRDRQRNALTIIRCLRENPTLTQEQVAKRLKLSRKTVNQCLKDLEMR